MLQTKIVATIGPASEDEPTLAALLAAGLAVVRLNFSHGTHEQHRRTIRTVRRLASSAARAVAVMQDLQGPRIRTGLLAGGTPIALDEGTEVRLTAENAPSTPQMISVPDLPSGAEPGDAILIDEGKIRLRLTQAAPNLVAVVVQGGLLGERRPVNLPSSRMTGSVLTDKDRADLAFGLAEGVDYVALSFVRRAADLVEAQQYMERCGRRVPVIAKIERQEAINELRPILSEADAVMVARGDLGVELSPERVPVLQRRIIREANLAGKPVITATQMLESMIERPHPTRAEASDVANAVWDGTDAVMLSAETAIGRHPVAAVETMARIIGEAEAELPNIAHVPAPAHAASPQAVAQAARDLAERVGARAIVAFTQTGRTAAMLSQSRPGVPILAFSPDGEVCRRLALYWGVAATVHPAAADTEALTTGVEHILLQRGTVAPGDLLVVVGALPIEAPTNFVQVHQVAGAGRPSSRLGQEELAPRPPG